MGKPHSRQSVFQSSRDEEVPLKRIVLHIGTHKTGTTSFQKSLGHNRDALMARGVRPILSPRFHRGRRLQGLSANNVLFGDLLLRPGIKSVTRIRGGVPDWTEEQRRQRLDALADKLKAFPEDTLLISSEALCFLRTAEEYEALSRFLETVGRHVQVLVAFREDQAWRDSWTNHVTAKSRRVARIVRAESEDVSILGEWYFDKSAIRDFWKAFDTTEIDYDRQPNVIEALYEALGVPMDALETDIFVNKRRTEPATRRSGPRKAGPRTPGASAREHDGEATGPTADQADDVAEPVKREP